MEMPPAPALELAEGEVQLVPLFDDGHTVGNETISKIDAEDYGYCENCGAVIEKLPAPYTTLIHASCGNVEEFDRSRLDALATPDPIVDTLTTGEIIARVGDSEIRAPFTGVLRGLARDGSALRHELPREVELRLVGERDGDVVPHRDS